MHRPCALLGLDLSQASNGILTRVNTRDQTQIELATGVRVPYVEQGDRPRAPLVLVHAVGNSWRIFEGLLAHLPESVHAFALTQRRQESPATRCWCIPVAVTSSAGMIRPAWPLISWHS